ncbi:hypothetical protein AGDE_12925 [Angomonas deanei]|uniref:Uncharacterized protein n=1 Tax=Angomonas deanei TaxID=59799 RepID=A0A7G2CKU2_9TRYP|nr:hypothetical protein AGDE_12925 [Angomonas deanei]CAD2218832.1 hypothetical protein, conserved [Angomonas deanei]|eukprot:EPY23278.1 hypothetical protein AGDE_12925 [Angomonas deanei]
MREMQTLRQHLTTRHEGRLAHLEKEEDGVIARRERGKMEVERLKEKATLLEEEGETLKGEVAAVEQSLAEAQAALTPCKPR